MKKLLIYTIIAFTAGCIGKQSRENNISKKDNEISPLTEEKSVKPATNIPPPKVLRENEMIFFEGGVFKMGSEDGLPNERPVHEVKIKPFYIHALG